MAKQITKVRILIPKGMKVEDVIKNLQITFESVEPDPKEIKGDLSCCVDVAVVSPVSTVNVSG